MRMCAPMRVGAIEPVGIRKASITKPRKTNAITNAMTSCVTVSLTLLRCVGAGSLAGMGRQDSGPAPPGRGTPAPRHEYP